MAAKDEDAPAKEDPNASVFVSGVPNGCEKENLQAVMAQFGEVRKIVIKAEKHYAIIDFTDVEAAQRALDAPAPKHDGSILKVISHMCFKLTNSHNLCFCRLKSAVSSGIVRGKVAGSQIVKLKEDVVVAKAKRLHRRMATPQLARTLAKVLYVLL